MRDPASSAGILPPQPHINRLIRRILGDADQAFFGQFQKFSAFRRAFVLFYRRTRHDIEPLGVFVIHIEHLPTPCFFDLLDGFSIGNTRTIA